MNYEQILDLDLVTLDECMKMYENKHICTIINDGHIKDFISEDYK